MVEQISGDHKNLVLRLVRSVFPQAEVWAFGSRVSGTARRYSDLDLALKQREPLDRIARRHLMERLSASELPFRVEVVDYRTAEPEFQAVIDQTSVRWP